jgi:hypothetical protein
MQPSMQRLASLSPPIPDARRVGARATRSRSSSPTSPQASSITAVNGAGLFGRHARIAKSRCSACGLPRQRFRVSGGVSMGKDQEQVFVVVARHPRDHAGITRPVTASARDPSRMPSNLWGGRQSAVRANARQPGRLGDRGPSVWCERCAPATMARQKRKAFGR